MAIKVYHTSDDAPPEKAALSRKMFLAEAQMVGKLQHPNLMPIYDAGEEDGRCYVVTEHIHGARTLAMYCQKESLLRVDAVVEIIFKCARALHYANARGVIHRDIKPSNIMLTNDGDVRIIDFGIAVMAGDDFRTLLATGLTLVIVLQALLIMAGVLKLVPLTGITLPFVSYGGSSLLVNAVVVGMLLSLGARGGEGR